MRAHLSVYKNLPLLLNKRKILKANKFNIVFEFLSLNFVLNAIFYIAYFIPIFIYSFLNLPLFAAAALFWALIPFSTIMCFQVIHHPLMYERHPVKILLSIT